ncbi:uncharacterized protein LOC116311856 isoform X1 [Oreochromis aureus]|uniref:uncharacterized protein LOC116311856 isoform X2 n=1 Tax=Oreochromis aureus TaxID=47969 RepID=UPI0012BD0448|nr:uncharacterized protein LOC116311856 isoform X2 [Oreochromis aureus]XP_039463599.1 uncharacterized protein LOC116311856 isoform X1 [Oreochromis aureus]
MADEMQNGQEFLESDDFRRNAAIIITEMLNVSNNTPENTTELMDEILHSIFFLGTINKPAYTPEQILGDKFAELKALYPNPFDCYFSQLPRRSPFSCVLDMIVRLRGHENEEDIKATLQELILYLREDAQSEQKCLFSSVICISQADQGTVKHYGVSMSTSNKDARGIMVAVSCCHEWDEYVAGAVMTYFPNRKKNKRKDKTEIDGTIKLPRSVMCRAFSLLNGEEMLPCKSCATLFSLETTENQVWPYGNCAEPECLSNLFKNEAQVKDKVNLQKPESWTAKDKEIAKKMVLTSLKNSLKKVKFNQGMVLYTPQQA